MYKIIGADGKEYGPISVETLRQWMAEGRANAQSRIQLEGTTEWKPLSEFPELAAALPSALPPTPGAPGVLAPGGAGLNLVNGPSIGLIITAILNFLTGAGSLMFNLLVGASFLTAGAKQNEPWAGALSGTLAVTSNIIGILVSGLILFGALKMRKLESYGLAMTASILAMIPCTSPCCPVGLPIGIWALVVLSKPEVKNAFH
jgi:hypothetical protein